MLWLKIVYFFNVLNLKVMLIKQKQKTCSNYIVQEKEKQQVNGRFNAVFCFFYPIHFNLEKKRLVTSFELEIIVAT